MPRPRLMAINQVGRGQSIESILQTPQKRAFGLGRSGQRARLGFGRGAVISASRVPRESRELRCAVALESSAATGRTNSHCICCELPWICPSANPPPQFFHAHSGFNPIPAWENLRQCDRRDATGFCLTCCLSVWETYGRAVCRASLPLLSSRLLP